MNQPVNQAVNHNRFEVTDGDRLRWQWQAAHALTALLQNAPVLPPLIWTIGPAGALAGHLAGLIPAERMRERFQAWVAALELPERPPVSSSGGGVASGRRGNAWSDPPPGARQRAGGAARGRRPV